MKGYILHSLHEAQDALAEFIADQRNIDAIERAARLMAHAIEGGHKIIACGNGGSLCDATHFAEELTGRFRHDRRSLPGVAINDPAFISCTSNDFDYTDIFARYIEGLGCAGDVLLAISTSGNSANVMRAVRAAHENGIAVVGLTSTGDNLLSAEADVAICAPRTPFSDRIQEIHIKVIHILVEMIEKQVIKQCNS